MRRVLMVLLVSGCASQDAGLVKVWHVDQTGIRWVRGIAENCAGARAPQGCADWAKDPCVITMPEDAPDKVVAEEFKHCFGYLHQ